MADETEVTIEGVRLSYPHLFKPRENERDDGTTVMSYQASFLMEKDTDLTEKNKKRLNKAALAAMEAMFGSDRKKWPKLAPEKKFLRDGDYKDDDGYVGHEYVSTNSTERPVIVNRKRKPVEPNEPQAPYAGCYVNAVIRVWAQNNKYGKRLNAEVKAVQFVRDGEAFSSRRPVDPNEAFQEIGEDEDDLDSIGGDDDEDSVI